MIVSKKMFSAAALITAGLALAASAQAHGDKHEHGVVHLDVAIEGATLVLQLESPLDSVLGFEHQPRTPEQRQAVEQMLKRLRDGAALFSPNAQAGCRFEGAEIESALIAAPGTPASDRSDTADKAEHLDVDATYRFRCTATPALGQLTHQLFATFPRIQRIEAQVATPKGQRRQVLKRPTVTLSLGG